jgi:diguanylate cyclase (GGDEF)-like protein
MSIGLLLIAFIVSILSLLFSVCSLVRQRKLTKLNANIEKELIKLKELSSLDPLTEIPNRRRFDEVMGAEWHRMMRNSQFISVIMIDIDYFKRYNDNLGHGEGDRCLCAVARGLQESLHRSGDFVARYGGEEFCAILPDTDRSGAEKVGNRMLNQINSDGLVTISLGTASVVPTGKYTQTELIEAADKALYRAKDNGRNRVEISEEVPDGRG